MNKDPNEKTWIHLKGVIKSAWKKSSEKTIASTIGKKEHISQLVAAIQALSYGETREDIEEALRKFNKQWCKNSKKQH